MAVSHLFNSPKWVGQKQISKSCATLPKRRNRSLNPWTFKEAQGPSNPPKTLKEPLTSYIAPSSPWYSQDL